MPQKRVVIDFQKNGNFTIYSDPQIEVICRSAHTPENELYRYGSHPIPEEWLEGKRLGFKDDGSKTDRPMDLSREARANADGV